MALSGIYGPISRQQAEATIEEALGSGIRLFDTAPLYGNGANEELLGQLLHSRNVRIASKFGLCAGADGKLRRDSRPETIRTSVEASLRRLQRDRIDFLFQHRVDPEVDKREVAGAIQRLMDEGKVGAFGLSSVTIEQADRMDTHLSISALQNELSLSSPENKGEPAKAMTRGWTYFAYAPLGRGLLTGTKPADDDYRATLSFNGKADLPFRLQELSRRTEIAPAALALGWVTSRADNVIALAGCRSPEQVRTALLAGALGPEELAVLTAELG